MKRKIAFDCFADTVGSGYGSVYQNFTIALLKKGINLIGMDDREKPDIQIYLGQPDRRWQNEWIRKADIFGIFTMFETQMLPEFWVEDINNSFDFVLVPSTWCKEIFEKGGVIKPVFVVPLGVNPASFFFLKRPARKVFNILWQGFHKDDRKGLKLLERVFDELNLPDTRLVIKTTPFSTYSQVQWEFKTNRWSFCKNMTPAELLIFLREMDLSVNPTAGEGFGLIPLEHMATGLPVLVSENTGCLDYRNPLYNIGIECKPGESCFGKEYGTSMIPDYNDLKMKIAYAYDNKDQMWEMGKAAAGWVAKEWTYEKSVDKLMEVLDDFVS